MKDKFSNYFEDFQELQRKPKKMPTSAKQNLTPSGKRKPMSPDTANRLYDKELDAKKFQKIARVFYRTASVGKLLYLTNEITNTTIRIDFARDKFGYVKIVAPHKHVELLSKCKFNSCVFKTIIKHNIF